MQRVKGVLVSKYFLTEVRLPLMISNKTNMNCGDINCGAMNLTTALYIRPYCITLSSKVQDNIQHEVVASA